MKYFITIFMLLILVGCNGNDKPQPQPPPSTSWQFVAGSKTGVCDDFDFPNSGEAGYCVKGWNGVKLGQTVKMVFTISGSGTLRPTDPSDIPPATIRLILWGQGQNDRWFTHMAINLTSGQQTVSVAIDPVNWGGVGGGVTQPPFESVLSDINKVGYTFGGQYFAGHGVAANGSVHFHLDSYQIN